MALVALTNRIGSGGVVLMPNGTNSLPGLAFGSDLDNGFYRVGANAIAITAGGSTAAVFEAAQTSFRDPIVIDNGAGTEILFVNDTQTDIRSDHSIIVTVDRDNDASGACSFQVHGGQNGLRMLVHDNPLVVQLGPDSDTPQTQEIKSADGLTAATGSDFRLKAGEAAGEDENGATLILAGGQASGSGTPGGIAFQTSITGASGTTVRSLTTRLTLTETALTFADGVDIAVGTTTGTSLGTSAAMKTGMHGAKVVQSPDWSVSSLTPTKTLDAGSADAATVRSVLGTLVQACIDKGILGAAA